MVEEFQNTLIGTINLDHKTSSTKIIMDAVEKLFNKIINRNLLVRRINITANNVIDFLSVNAYNHYEQIDLFTDYKQKVENQLAEQSEKELQKAVINIKRKYGKNAIIKGMNLQEGSTTINRNMQIGGHSE